MPDTPPAHHKPITISGFLLSSLLTGAMICGGIGALAVVFLADGVIDVGPDPAIPVAEVKQQISQTDQRIAQLEKMVRQKQAAPAPVATADVEELQKTVAANTEQTQALQEKIDTMSSNTTEDNKAAQIALGLTQIKTAFENDLPVAAGIDTLKKSVSSESLQKTLNDLAQTTEKNFPTKKELLDDLGQMQASLTPAPVDPAKLTWDQRAKYEMGKFVKVTPKQVAVEQSLIAQTQNFIRNNDFTAALETVKQMPASAQQALFYKKIELRVQAEMMVHSIITDVTQKIGQTTGMGNGGSLY